MVEALAADLTSYLITFTVVCFLSSMAGVIVGNVLSRRVFKA